MLLAAVSAQQMTQRVDVMRRATHHKRIRPISREEEQLGISLLLQS
jgi:hypothetical protein